jgi:hypothetical protein
VARRGNARALDPGRREQQLDGGDDDGRTADGWADCDTAPQAARGQPDGAGGGGYHKHQRAWTRVQPGAAPYPRCVSSASDESSAAGICTWPALHHSALRFSSLMSHHSRSPTLLYYVSTRFNSHDHVVCLVSIRATVSRRAHRRRQQCNHWVRPGATRLSGRAERGASCERGRSAVLYFSADVKSQRHRHADKDDGGRAGRRRRVV